MDKSEYYAMLNRLTEKGYGWQAVQDLIKMLCMEWNVARVEASEARWQINTALKFIDSDMSNKRKLDAINGVLREVASDECN